MFHVVFVVVVFVRHIIYYYSCLRQLLLFLPRLRCSFFLSLFLVLISNALPFKYRISSSYSCRCCIRIIWFFFTFYFSSFYPLFIISYIDIFLYVVYAYIYYGDKLAFVWKVYNVVERLLSSSKLFVCLS